MEFRPSRHLKNIEPNQWERLRKLATEAGAPYIDRHEVIAIDVKSRSWIGAITKYYKKGKFELDFALIRNPFKKIEKLRPLKDKVYDWALERAEHLVNQL